jgi:hypothetical protein
MMMRRVAFPVILFLFVGGLAALLYVAPDLGTQGQSLRQLIGLDPTPSTTAARPQPMPRDTASRSTGLTGGQMGNSDAASDGPLGTGYANLSVYSEPAGATVLVDGDSIGATPLNRYSIRSGVYIITVERDSFFAADTVAVLRNNQAPTYAVTLNPRPELPNEDLAAQRQDAPNTSSPATSGSAGGASSTESASSQLPTTTPPPEPVPTTGSLQLTSTPTGAQVELDGRVVGTTPLTLNDVEAGAYEVAFTRSGYDTTRMSVAVTAGQERRLTAALTPQMGQLRVLARPWGTIYVDGELRERNADVWYEMPVSAGEHEIAVVHPALGRQTRTVTVSAGEQLSVVIDLRNPSPSTAQEDTTQTESSNRSS